MLEWKLNTCLSCSSFRIKYTRLVVSHKPMCPKSCSSHRTLSAFNNLNLGGRPWFPDSKRGSCIRSCSDVFDFGACRSIVESSKSDASSTDNNFLLLYSASLKDPAPCAYVPVIVSVTNSIQAFSAKVFRHVLMVEGRV